MNDDDRAIAHGISSCVLSCRTRPGTLLLHTAPLFEEERDPHIDHIGFGSTSPIPEPLLAPQGQIRRLRSPNQCHLDPACQVARGVALRKGIWCERPSFASGQSEVCISWILR